MNADELLRQYAEYLIRDHAQDVEYLTISEMWDQFFNRNETISSLTEDDEKKVHEYIASANITITWNED